MSTETVQLNLQANMLVLDGPVGTRLTAGPTGDGSHGLPLPLSRGWSGSALGYEEGKERIVAIHREDLAAFREAKEQVEAQATAAGIDLAATPGNIITGITANTFRTEVETYLGWPLKDREARAKAWQQTRLACELAKAALWDERAEDTIIFGSITTILDGDYPDYTEREDQAHWRRMQQRHYEHASNMLDSGITSVIVETMPTLMQAEAAVLGARDAGMECIGVGLKCDPNGLLYLGQERVVDAARRLGDLGVAFVTLNCCSQADALAGLGLIKQEQLTVPYGTYPQAPRFC